MLYFSRYNKTQRFLKQSSSPDVTVSFRNLCVLLYREKCSKLGSYVRNIFCKKLHKFCQLYLFTRQTTTLQNDALFWDARAPSPHISHCKKSPYSTSPMLWHHTFGTTPVYGTTHKAPPIWVIQSFVTVTVIYYKKIKRKLSAHYFWYWSIKPQWRVT